MLDQKVPQALYRFYGPDGQLLYIGITLDLGARWLHHSKNKPWWRDVARCTVEHFDDRGSVEAAEVAAIRAEKPLHNIQHNRRRPRSPKSAKLQGGADSYTFRTRTSGYEWNTPLWLGWEVYCDPISDDYYVDEASPEELWEEWRSRYPRDPKAEEIFGPGAMTIYWQILGHTICEAAPFQDLRPIDALMREDGRKASRENFLTFFTLPEHAASGDLVRWSSLPVEDKVWRERDLPTGPHTLKGGFIQEATGWKPSPLQPFVNVHQLERLAGFLPSGRGVLQ